jgi:hypothetical protein
MSPQGIAALDYVARGMAVFPVFEPTASGKCSCWSAECTSPAKHPRVPHGVNDASTDPLRVEDWWGEWPNANIGIATGAASCVAVLDIDPRHGGTESLLALKSRVSLPRTATVFTGGGGRHLYFRCDEAGAPRSSAGKLGRGLDVRGSGGYVVAPPSVHISGRPYAWERRRPFARWPMVLDAAGDRDIKHVARPVERRGSGKYAQSALAAEIRRVTSSVPGHRNNDLNAASFNLGTLVGAGMLDVADVVHALFIAADECGLPKEEAERTIRSGLCAGAANPREVR